MNIKQAEALSGVSRQNIRFYEREGLIAPDRNPENDYREYNEQHIHRLKQIRAMRMLDMPLEQIKSVLTGKVRFGEAVQIQETLLRRQMEELSAAIRFCGELKSLNNVSEMNVDEILIRMKSPENKKKLSWRSGGVHKTVKHPYGYDHTDVFLFLRAFAFLVILLAFFKALQLALFLCWLCLGSELFKDFRFCHFS